MPIAILNAVVWGTAVSNALIFACADIVMAFANEGAFHTIRRMSNMDGVIGTHCFIETQRHRYDMREELETSENDLERKGRSLKVGAKEIS